ncbi:MAG: FtsH protease activity modulator HflK [Gammaproteobacteria bacterium]
MAWNEPGGSGGDKDKDPWGNRGKNQGPPDLDEVIKNVQKKISGIFGGGGGSGGGGSANSKGILSVVAIVAALAVLVWGFAGIYIVDEGKQAVVLQFGKFNSISDPGPHWLPVGIQDKVIINVSGVRKINIGQGTDEALMLTGDDNIVDVEYVIQYNIKNAKDYLFKDVAPDQSILLATQSSVREVVGNEEFDAVIKDRRIAIAEEVKVKVQKILDLYKTGIQLRGFDMQKSVAPGIVLPAFFDVKAAEQEKEQTINKANGYANSIVPRAEGQAARIIHEAQAYKAEIIARANGETTRFTKILKEYEKAPKVTRQRLYLETMETVFADSNKVMIDVKGGNNIMYLPLDQIAKTRKSFKKSDSELFDTLNIESNNSNDNSTDSSSSQDRIRRTR